MLNFLRRKPIDNEHVKINPAEFGGGRKEPYTNAEIVYRMCSKKGCLRGSYSTWQACADKNLHRPLCAEHDIELNKTALLWFGDPEWQEKIIAYAARVQSEIDRKLELLWLPPNE
jgi:hypothetical protein